MSVASLGPHDETAFFLFSISSSRAACAKVATEACGVGGTVTDVGSRQMNVFQNLLLVVYLDFFLRWLFRVTATQRPIVWR